MPTLIANITPLPTFLKDPNCPICNEAKSTRAQCRSKTYGKPDELPKLLKFGESLTADHKTLNDDHASREAGNVAIIILDRYSRWLQGYAAKLNRLMNTLSISNASSVLSLSLSPSSPIIQSSCSKLVRN